VPSTFGRIVWNELGGPSGHRALTVAPLRVLGHFFLSQCRWVRGRSVRLSSGRHARFFGNRGSCVLATTVTPSVEHRSRNMRTTVSPVRWSRLAVGSSARTSVGLLISDRAIRVRLLFAARHLRGLVVDAMPESDQIEQLHRPLAKRLAVVRLEHQW